MESWRLHETKGQNGTEQKNRRVGDDPSTKGAISRSSQAQFAIQRFFYTNNFSVLSAEIVSFGCIIGSSYTHLMKM